MIDRMKAKESRTEFFKFVSESMRAVIEQIKDQTTVSSQLFELCVLAPYFWLARSGNDRLNIPGLGTWKRTTWKRRTDGEIIIKGRFVPAPFIIRLLNPDKEVKNSNKIGSEKNENRRMPGPRSGV